MRFLLTPFGSSGDVHPYVGIGRELLSRGHEVVLCSAEPHRDVVERAGILFVSTVSAEAYHAVTRDPDLWHPRRGLAKVIEMACSGLEAAWRALADRYEPGHTVLVGHAGSFATRVFEEQTGAPSATLHLAPSSLRSAHQVPAFPPGVDISALPLWCKRALWAAVDRLAIDPLAAPALNRFRAVRGLPAARGIFKSWINSPRAVIGLFPAWFGPRQPDWPAQFLHASFPLWDDPAVATDPEAERFLSDGPPPIVFSPGSANRQATAFFAAALAALRRLGRRGLFLTGYPEQLPPEQPDSVLHRPYLPFSAVLPRAAAFVHHGGIGSLAQGLAAGTPQLIMPMSHDQPDNAMRAARLGVARWLPPRRFTERRVAEALALLLDSEAVRRAAAAARERVGAVNGPTLAADLLECVAAS